MGYYLKQGVVVFKPCSANNNSTLSDQKSITCRDIDAMKYLRRTTYIKKSFIARIKRISIIHRASEIKFMQIFEEEDEECSIKLI